MRIFRLMLIAAMVTACPAVVQAQSISGVAKAVDGDTLEFSGTRVRLLGIDAPELKQICSKDTGEWACGTDAMAALAQMIDGAEIVCSGSETDVYGRLMAICRRDGLDLGLAMIEAGLATSLPNGGSEYAAAESLRKTHRVGLWAGEFQSPAEWREANPRETTAQPKRPITRAASKARQAPSGRSYRNRFGCAIKGNRSQRGEWIYHLPGQHYYDDTRPEELFCTEAQAQRAGYRRSKV